MNRIRRILIIGYLLSFTLPQWSTTAYHVSVERRSARGPIRFKQRRASFYDKAYSSDPQSGKDDIYKDSAERATLITSSSQNRRGFRRQVWPKKQESIGSRCRERSSPGYRRRLHGAAKFPSQRGGFFTNLSSKHPRPTCRFQTIASTRSGHSECSNISQTLKRLC